MNKEQSNTNRFEAATLEVITIIDDCLTEARYLKRSEIQKIDEYFNEYADYSSDLKTEFASIYSSFSLDLQYIKTAKEEEIEKIIQHYKESVQDLKQQIEEA